MSRPSSGPPATLESLGVTGDAQGLIEVALTHRSYAFEQPEPAEHNERLECLGDQILGAIVTIHIFNAYPELTEGQMSRLRSSVVSANALAGVARRLGLGPHIRLGKGEEASGGNDKPSLLADTLEAVIGAAFVQYGLDHVSEWVLSIFGPLIEDRLSEGGPVDPKTELQEEVVRLQGELPRYRIASSGPEHDKRFIAHVYMGERLLGAGRGRSKKEAEQAAAREALDGIAHAPADETTDSTGGGEASARAS